MSFNLPETILLETILISFRAAAATKDAEGSFQKLEEELQKPANWQPHQSEGVWSKVKKTITGSPPTAAEKTQQTAKEAIAATQKAADEAVARAKKVPLWCLLITELWLLSADDVIHRHLCLLGEISAVH